MSEILGVLIPIFLVLNVPIAFSLALGSMIAIAIVQQIPVMLVVQRMFTAMDTFVLLALPLFMISGRLMEKGGISRRLIALASNVVGRVPGGLAFVAILACLFFGAISGSPAATVVAIGTIMVPHMIKSGYDKYFSVGLMAAAGMLGGIIPPSIPFVTYGITMNTSIGKLFMAGFLPGSLMGICLMLLCYFIARKHGWRGDVKASFKGFLIAFKESVWGLMMPGIILGGIYGGIFTPTEAAAVSCVYAVIVGAFIYRELTLKEFFIGMAEAGTTAAMVMIILGAATAMGWILTAEQIPAKVAEVLSSFAHEKWQILLILNIILLITGCMMELNASVIILGPIFLPLLLQYNIDLVHFGVIMIVNMSLGLLTPPLGMNVFIATSLADNVLVNRVFRASMPHFLVLMIALILITMYPEISLFLVNFFNLK